MSTVPVPVKMNGPKLKVMKPVEASAVILTGVPTRVGSVENVNSPTRVGALWDKRELVEFPARRHLCTTPRRHANSEGEEDGT